MQSRSFSGELQPLGDEVAVVQDVVVAERRALGVAGRARGELDVDRVVELQLRPELGELHPLGIAAGRRDIVEVQHARRLVLAEPHDVLEVRQLLGLHQVVDDLEIVRGLERRRQDQRLALDLVHRVLELGAPVGRVDVDQHQPRLGGGELGQRPFGVLGDQMPMRSPRSSPSVIRPAARSSTRRPSSPQVQRTFWCFTTSASRSR